jgi:hypothetical protein
MLLEFQGRIWQFLFLAVIIILCTYYDLQVILRFETQNNDK